MTNIVIIFVLSTNASCCILLDKNKNIYATFLIIFVGEAVFMFQKIILELTLIDNQLTWIVFTTSSLERPRELIGTQVVDIVVKAPPAAGVCSYLAWRLERSLRVRSPAEMLLMLFLITHTPLIIGLDSLDFLPRGHRRKETLGSV